MEWRENSLRTAWCVGKKRTVLSCTQQMAFFPLITTKYFQSYNLWLFSYLKPFLYKVLRDGTVNKYLSVDYKLNIMCISLIIG